MSPGKVSTLAFDKFYNIVDGKQRSADNFTNGVNPATKQKLWDVWLTSPTPICQDE